MSGEPLGQSPVNADSLQQKLKPSITNDGKEEKKKHHSIIIRSCDFVTKKSKISL